MEMKVLTEEKALRRAADAQMFAPVRRGGGVGFRAGLFGIWIMEQPQQPIDLGIVLLLGLLDGPLSEVVTQDVFGIHPIHSATAFIVSTPLIQQPIAILSGPNIKPIRIQKMLAQPFIGGSCSG